MRAALGLSAVRFVPAGDPPHRAAPVATAAHRLAMVELAIAGRPGSRSRRARDPPAGPELHGAHARGAAQRGALPPAGADRRRGRFPRTADLASLAGALRSRARRRRGARPGVTIEDALPPALADEWARRRCPRRSGARPRQPQGRSLVQPSRRIRSPRRRYARSSRAAPTASPRCAVCFRPRFWPILTATNSTAHARMRLNKIQKTAVTALEDIKARDITVLDVRKLTSLYRHHDHRVGRVESAGEGARAPRPRPAEGRPARRSSASRARRPASGCWSTPGNIIIHIMQPAVRAHYNLEELWTPPAAKRRARAPTAPRPSATAGSDPTLDRPVRSVAAPGRNRVPRPASPCHTAMKLRVVALGHRMPAWVDAGWDDYARRMPREFALELVQLKPEPRDSRQAGCPAARRRGAADRGRLQGRARRRARRARGAVDDAQARRAISCAGATKRATSPS